MENQRFERVNDGKGTIFMYECQDCAFYVPYYSYINKQLNTADCGKCPYYKGVHPNEECCIHFVNTQKGKLRYHDFLFNLQGPEDNQQSH